MKMRNPGKFDDMPNENGNSRRLKPGARVTGGNTPASVTSRVTGGRNPASIMATAKPAMKTKVSKPGVAGWEKGSPLKKPLATPAKRLNKLAGLKPRGGF